MVTVWIFLLIMDLIIPSVMIGFGSYFFKKPPKNINSIFGYRTAMSMKNRETWEFAHHYCGKIWRITGWVIFIVTIIPVIFMFGKEADIVGIYGGIICAVQLIPLVASIIPVELALKKNFDENGFRR